MSCECTTLVLATQLYVDWTLIKSIRRQFEAFAHGFHRVCGGPALVWEPASALCCMASVLVGARKCTSAERSAAANHHTTQALCVPEELELLICGSPDLDFDGLHKAATYDDGYHPDHRVIAWFWEIVRAMCNDNKKKLLNFVTGMLAAHWYLMYSSQLLVCCALCL
jgi:ubiquitin-protein ligase E3 A